MPLPLDDLAINVRDLVAGFLGGVVRIFTFGAVKPFEAAGAVLVGAITANYLAPSCAKYLSLPEAPSGFIVGLAGMQIVLTITDMVKGWKPTRGSDAGNPTKL
jgi:uncharacterized membrane protein YeaQ/YmgE (transglycosylase-associated protein family)